MFEKLRVLRIQGKVEVLKLFPSCTLTLNWRELARFEICRNGGNNVLPGVRLVD